MSHTFLSQDTAVRFNETYLPRNVTENISKFLPQRDVQSLSETSRENYVDVNFTRQNGRLNNLPIEGSGAVIKYCDYDGRPSRTCNIVSYSADEHHKLTYAKYSYGKLGMKYVVQVQKMDGWYTVYTLSSDLNIVETKPYTGRVFNIKGDRSMLLCTKGFYFDENIMLVSEEFGIVDSVDNIVYADMDHTEVKEVWFRSVPQPVVRTCLTIIKNRDGSVIRRPKLFYGSMYKNVEVKHDDERDVFVLHVGKNKFRLPEAAQHSFQLCRPNASHLLYINYPRDNDMKIMFCDTDKLKNGKNDSSILRYMTISSAVDKIGETFQSIIDGGYDYDDHFMYKKGKLFSLYQEGDTKDTKVWLREFVYEKN